MSNHYAPIEDFIDQDRTTRDIRNAATIVLMRTQLMRRGWQQGERTTPHLQETVLEIVEVTEPLVAVAAELELLNDPVFRDLVASPPD